MMRDLPRVRVNARAVDVGYFNTKYTTGRYMSESSMQIGVGMFPSLAPRLSGNVMMHSPGTVAADGCIIQIDGVRYFVGTGAVFNSSGVEPRPVLSDYAISDKYLALLRGALYYMAKEAGASVDLEIDHLVLGLPLNTYNQYRGVLPNRVEKEHIITIPTDGGSVRITVNKVAVADIPRNECAAK